MKNVIHCQSLDDLIKVCEACLMRGVVFSADTHSLTVVLTKTE